MRNYSFWMSPYDFILYGWAPEKMFKDKDNILILLN